MPFFIGQIANMLSTLTRVSIQSRDSYDVVGFGGAEYIFHSWLTMYGRWVNFTYLQTSWTPCK